MKTEIHHTFKRKFSVFHLKFHQIISWNLNRYLMHFFDRRRAWRGLGSLLRGQSINGNRLEIPLSRTHHIKNLDFFYKLWNMAQGDETILVAAPKDFAWFLTSITSIWIVAIPQFINSWTFCSYLSDVFVNSSTHIPWSQSKTWCFYIC